MPNKKLSIFSVLMLVTVCSVSATAARAADWAGVYSHEEESFEPDGSRISYWFRLKVTDPGDGKLTAVLSNGFNSKTTRRIQLKVTAMGTARAQFSYDHCLPLIDGQTYQCHDEYHENDALFALEQVPRHCEYSLETEWQKLDLASQTESGDSAGRISFFKKTL